MEKNSLDGPFQLGNLVSAWAHFRRLLMRDACCDLDLTKSICIYTNCTTLHAKWYAHLTLSLNHRHIAGCASTGSADVIMFNYEYLRWGIRFKVKPGKVHKSRLFLTQKTTQI